MAKALGALALVVALVFGYFLQKSNWDFTLAKSMIAFEFNKLTGDSKTSSESQVSTEEAASEPAQPTRPSGPAPTKDSMYKDGNTFSDMKRTGNESAYKPTP